MKRLCIISHTEHYYTASGELVGLASTVMEVNALATLFDEVVHVAVLHFGIAPQNTMAYTSEHIRFVPIPSTGGKNLISKLELLRQAFRIMSQVKQAVAACDVYQFRAPTGMGVFVLPWLIYASNKPGWYKYAGNWKQQGAPWSYRWQRWLLLKQSQPVTINGKWTDQPAHCLSFENPCLTQTEYEAGQAVCAHKSLPVQGIQLCFVGRMEAAKGPGLFLEALQLLQEKQKESISKIHMVGDGTDVDYLKDLSNKTDLSVIFHGLLERSKVHEVYKQCHAIVLPSASEGFPKVIAEAMNYGCVPIVSNISSIGQYINNGRNGLLIKYLNSDSVLDTLNTFLNIENQFYKDCLQINTSLSRFFTFDAYLKNIQLKVLDVIINEL
jgi:glycosyltransferase involved in cell wall biosynthesis